MSPESKLAASRPVRRPAAAAPSLREERRLLRSGHRLLAAVDEVGRGALAGPVSVGIVLVHAGTRSAPAGVRDSKLLTPAARVALVPRIRRWAPAHAVGHAEPEEIDEIGIIAALRLAAVRALASLPERPDCVLLDGNHDWITPRPAVTTAPLFDLPSDAPVASPAPPVVTRIKADLRCAAVAAASVLAKVERDSIMIARSAHFPQYGWDLNKGYSAPEHAAALRRHGPSVQHRQSWSLPGAGADPDQLVLDVGVTPVAVEDVFPAAADVAIDLSDGEPPAPEDAIDMPPADVEVCG